jgi:putative transposase
LGEADVTKSRFTVEQIIEILQEQQTGSKVSEVCIKHGISQPTFYGWKAKFGGLSVSNARRLRQLEEENAKLRRLLAEALLDNAVMKGSTRNRGQSRAPENSCDEVDPRRGPLNLGC